MVLEVNGIHISKVPLLLFKMRSVVINVLHSWENIKFRLQILFFLMLAKLQVNANKCYSKEILFCCIMLSEIISLRHAFLHFLG